MTVLDETSLRLLLQVAPVAVVAVDGTGTIIYVNDKFCELFRYGMADLFGQPLELLLPEAVRAQHAVHRARFAQAPYIRPMGSGMDLSGRRKDGSTFPLEAGLSPIQVADQQIVLSTVIDITHRKQNEEMLEQRVAERTQEIEHRRQIADSLRDILSRLNADYSLQEILQYIVDQTGLLLHADGSAIFLFDRADDAYKIQVWQGLEEMDIAAMTIPAVGASLLKRVLTTRQAAYIPNLHVGDLGHDATAHARRELLLTHGYQALIVVPLLVNDEAYGSLVTYYNAPHEFAEEEINLAMLFGTQISLAVQNTDLRRRGEEQAVTAERSRIARDLHDSVTQTLYATGMIAEVLPQLWTLRPDEGMRRLEELRELTRGALAEMRTLLLELRPATLADVPLPELLQQLVDGIRARGKLVVDFQVTGDCSLTVETRVAFFRTAQEALTNIVKHAQATTATVALVNAPQSTRLTIIDNGCGFVLDNIPPNHLGLDIMRERAAAIRGTLSVDSAPDNGTTIQLTWQRSDE